VVQPNRDVECGLTGNATIRECVNGRPRSEFVQCTKVIYQCLIGHSSFIVHRPLTRKLTFVDHQLFEAFKSLTNSPSLNIVMHHSIKTIRCQPYLGNPRLLDFPQNPLSKTNTPERKD
jgi:hypothetical protein